MTDISHVSTKPWSDYSSSDYTLDQWYNACLIRPPRSELTSKSQCKLPIRTPNGAVNRNGVFAAAAALAGARSEVKASSEEKAKAAKTLLRLYREMDQAPPDSLKRIGGLQMTNILEKPGTPQELVHYGVKGMKWGVRKDRSGGSGGSSKKSEKKAARKARNEAIKSARARQQERTAEAAKSELKFYKSMVTGGRKEAYNTMRDSYDNVNYNKDAALANRMTSGEKVVAGLLAGGAAALWLAGAAAKDY